MTILLRPDQQRVAGYRRGYMAVPAVPGAGKTTVLAYLAADLIASRLPEPGRILIVTYTNSAVANFRSRIAQYLEERGLPRNHGFEVRTIHSLALQVVRERPDGLGWSENFRVIDEGRLNTLLEGLTGRWISRNRPVWESMIKPDLTGAMRSRAADQWQGRTKDLVRSLIQGFKSRKLSPDTAFRLTRHLPDTSALRWAAEVYLDYQRELALEGVVDFGDLMWGAHQLLAQDGELLARLRQRWTYLFEDEAQDSYRLQEAVLRLLAGPGGNLVRVGDPNQAIMGTFTSAEPALFRRFCAEDGVEIAPLTMAGRSSQDIIDLANELVRWTRAEHPESGCRDSLADQHLAPVPPEWGAVNPQPAAYTIVSRTYATQEQELTELARIAARSTHRSPEKTLAILLPTNFMVTVMLEELDRQGVLARPVGGQTEAERQQTTLDLLAVLAFLAVPHEADRLRKALTHLGAVSASDESELARFLLQCRPEELFFPLDGSAPYQTLYTACPAAQHDTVLGEGLRRLSGWLQNTLIPADELVVNLANDLALSGEQLAIAHHLSLRARLLLQDQPAFGLTDAVQHLYEELQAMGRFSDTMFDRKGFTPSPGVVYVTTCHAAKGLEWDTVFVASLTRGEFPSLAQDKVRSELWFLPEGLINPEALALAELDQLLGEVVEGEPVSRAKREIIAERLRLLYVAVTRARENLMLSHHQKDRWGKAAYPTGALQHLHRWIDLRRRERPLPLPSQ